MELNHPPSLPPQMLHQQSCTARLQQDRESEGRCGLCGVQTHRLCYADAGGGSMLCKEPLDVEGEVRRGRCLLCHPMSSQDEGTVYSDNGAVGGCPTYSYPFVDTSPSNVYDFPFALQAQQQQIPPLPLQSNGQFAPSPMSQHPSVAVIQSMMQQQLSPFPMRSTCPVTNITIPQQPSLATIQSIPNLDITSILTLMRLHPTSHALITTALQALDILASDEQNAAALVRVGAIDTILNSMSIYLSCVTAIQYGVAILHSLSLNTHNRPLMTDAVRPLVNVMNAYRAHASIQRHSILALGNIAKGNIDHKILICEEGGMMAIMKAVEMFGRGAGGDSSVEEGVLRAAYWSLRRLGMPRLRGLVVNGNGREDDSEGEDD